MAVEFNDDRFKKIELEKIGGVNNDVGAVTPSNEKMDVVEFATQYNVWDAEKEFNGSDPNKTVTVSNGASGAAPVTSPNKPLTVSNTSSTNNTAAITSVGSSGQIQETALPSALKGVNDSGEAGSQPDYAKPLKDVYNEYDKYIKENKIL